MDAGRMFLLMLTLAVWACDEPTPPVNPSKLAPPAPSTPMLEQGDEEAKAFAKKLDDERIELGSSEGIVGRLKAIDGVMDAAVVVSAGDRSHPEVSIFVQLDARSPGAVTAEQVTAIARKADAALASAKVRVSFGSTPAP